MMVSTGVVRRIDDLGRIVIPKEIRKKFDIREGDPLELYVDNDGITLKPYDFCEPYKERVRRLAEALADDDDIPNKANITKALDKLMSELKGEK